MQNENKVVLEARVSHDVLKAYSPSISALVLISIIFQNITTPPVNDGTVLIGLQTHSFFDLSLAIKKVEKRKDLSDCVCTQLRVKTEESFNLEALGALSINKGIDAYHQSNDNGESILIL